MSSLSIQTLLQQPFVDQLQCTDPTDPSGESKTTIYGMVSYYRSVRSLQ